MIERSFFQRDPLRCARELIGTLLVWEGCAGLVVETEAYRSVNDEACHTFVRSSTRSFLRRNPAGAAYIYLNYGMHWMLNATVKGGEHEGFVLVRALEPTEGLELMRKRRGVEDVLQLCSGPGKLTKALQITSADDERDLCSDSQRCFYDVGRGADMDVVADARIGITKSAHLPWRFTLGGSRFTSRPPRPALGCDSLPRTSPL
ncbi:MAG: DNA-3-methyladenine glycosylase [Chthoniobacterales bacterium]|nr:DNA-3-methyladenine glycosylase [Chthoniobacterales bacterium]